MCKSPYGRQFVPVEMRDASMTGNLKRVCDLRVGMGAHVNSGNNLIRKNPLYRMNDINLNLAILNLLGFYVPPLSYT